MTRADVLAVLDLLAANYHRDLTREPAMVDLWTIAFADDDAATVRQAVIRYMTSAQGRFWPTLADILTPLHAAAASDADQAWAAVAGQIRAVGRYAVPHFADPAVAEVVAAIGWSALCDGRPDVVRGQFLRCYATLRDRRRDAAAAASLLGRLVTAADALPAPVAPEALAAVWSVPAEEP